MKELLAKYTHNINAPQFVKICHVYKFNFNLTNPKSNRYMNPLLTI